LPPFFALAGQLDAQAKYMLELNWGPLVGAAVIRKQSWDRVPASARESMMQIAAEIGLKVRADGRAENVSSVAAMERRGLKVQKVTPEVDAEWRAVIDKIENQIRGKSFRRNVRRSTKGVEGIPRQRRQEMNPPTPAGGQPVSRLCPKRHRI